MSVPGVGTLGEERPPANVAAQHANGAVARPELEGVGLVVRLVILGGRDLEDGAGPGRSDERVAREGIRGPELETPLGRDLLGGMLELAHPRGRERIVLPGLVSHREMAGRPRSTSRCGGSRAAPRSCR